MSGVGLLAAGVLVMAPGPATASPGSLFAYPNGGATGSPPASCPQTATTSDECTLAQALELAGPGDTVELAAGGPHVGNFTLSTAGTSALARVTIEPASGVTDPTLDGNSGAVAGCSTAACDGPVLTIGANVYAALSGITIQNADNTATGLGGGVFMDDGADLTVAGSAFTGNSAQFYGGAIDNADAGTGTLTVSNSVFTGNTASEGGAIDNADEGNANAVDGTLTVSGSTFVNNVTTGPGEGGGGGAIDSGDHPGAGTATVTVSDSTFANNDAGSSGGAINSTGPTALSVTTSTFAGNSAVIEGDAINDFGPVVVTANEFADSCSQLGTWTDGGYNAGDSSCFANSPPSTDKADSSLASELGPLADNGGPTRTILLEAGNSGAALIPNGTATLCPTTDQRGVTSPAGAACNAGAVQPAGTTTTVTSSANPSTPGQSVTITATVAPDSPATNTPTGTVQFSLDGGPLGGPVALTNGTATFSSSSLPAGPHTISAAYSGDPNDAASTSPDFTQTVTTPPPPPPPPALGATTTSLTVPSGPIAYGSTVHLSATVTPRSPGLGTPSGLVQFSVDGHPVGGPVTLQNGRASTTTTGRLAAGAHTVTADYRGSAVYSGSSDSKTITIVRKTTPSPSPSSAAPTTAPATPTASSAAAPTRTRAPAQLASTGSDIGGRVWLAVLLLAGGLGLLTAGRTRRGRHTR